MESRRTCRHIPLTAVAFLAGGLAFAGCKSDQTTGVNAGPKGTFKGTLVGASVSGVLTINFPTAAAAPVASVVHLALMGTEAATAVSRTLLLQNGGGTVSLAGSYDPNATPQLTLSGGPPNYTITGSFASNQQFS